MLSAENHLDIAKLTITEEDKKKQQEWAESNTLTLQMPAQVLLENKTI